MFTAGATEGPNIVAEWYKDAPWLLLLRQSILQIFYR